MCTMCTTAPTKRKEDFYYNVHLCTREWRTNYFTVSNVHQQKGGIILRCIHNISRTHRVSLHWLGRDGTVFYTQVPYPPPTRMRVTDSSREKISRKEKENKDDRKTHIPVMQPEIWYILSRICYLVVAVHSAAEGEALPQFHRENLPHQTIGSSSHMARDLVHTVYWITVY